jgi:hypothetical protein
VLNSFTRCRLIAFIIPILASIVGPPRSAINISAVIAACHSGASCSAFGSFVMYVPASSSVTSSRPPGQRDRISERSPPALVSRQMAPAIFVRLDFEPFPATAEHRLDMVGAYVCLIFCRDIPMLHWRKGS